MLKCTCLEGETNQAGQSAAFLNRLQNPVLLQFLPLKPVSWYYGPVTGLGYYVGGRHTHICVDERDVDGMLLLRHNRQPVFKVYANTRTESILQQDAELPEPIGETADGVEPEPIVTNTLDYPSDFANLNVDGLAAGRSKRLLDAGYTVAQFAELAGDLNKLIPIATETAIPYDILVEAAKAAATWNL